MKMSYYKFDINVKKKNVFTQLCAAESKQVAARFVHKLLQSLVHFIVGAERRVSGVLGGEELPIVQQVVPRLKQPREYVKLKYGHMLGLGQLHCFPQLDRLVRICFEFNLKN